VMIIEVGISNVGTWGLPYILHRTQAHDPSNRSWPPANLRRVVQLPETIKRNKEHFTVEPLEND